MPSRITRENVEIKKWTGIKNAVSDERLKPGELASATDVDIDNTGKIWSRQGFTEIDGTAAHSLYSNPHHALVAHGTTLKLVKPDLTFTTLATLTNANPLSYDHYNGVTYYSNGVDKGRIKGSSALQWGVTPPLGQPAASQVGGQLPPATYRYALTFLRSDGHESGTGVAGEIDLPIGGGIAFSSIEVSTNPEVSGKILYLTSPNGEVMYKAMVMANSVTSAIYTNDALDLTVPLTTQFAGPPPAGSIVRVYNGTAYVIVGDVAYYSDPYQLELFRMDENYLYFDGQVAMFECGTDGVFAATADSPDYETGGIWYLGGGNPRTFRWQKHYDFGAIPGTAVKTEAKYFQPPDPDAPKWSRPAIIWSTRHGICIGYDDGSVQNLTEDKYSLSPAQRGAGLVRQTRGYAQYLVVLRGAGSANNVAP
jgi:hypothetical protein